MMAFDRTGLLFVGIGDGSRQGDPTGRAQDRTDILGKILRVDVDGGNPYSVPADNPFVADPGGTLPEIFALGVRNPYRGDIDPDSGDIYVADVGLGQREEVSAVVAGVNLGWNVREGSVCHSEQYGDCDDPSLSDPLVEYTHDNGNCAVIGGYFYRGSAIPSLQGRFLFGDYCTGKVSAVEFDNDGDAFERPLLDGGSGLGNILGFARDNDGEMYVITESAFFRIRPAGVANSSPGPAARLSDTGCTVPGDATKMADGLLAFEINAPLWSDGATKRRWLAIPDGQAIEVREDGDFRFPEGTVLVKEFSVAGERVETRLLMKDQTGAWSGYSYEWMGTEAWLLPAGKEKELPNGLTWRYPDRGECVRCHTPAAGFALGPEISQLNLSRLYSSTNRISNQLSTFEHIGVFSAPLPDHAGPAAGAGGHRRWSSRDIAPRAQLFAQQLFGLPSRGRNDAERYGPALFGQSHGNECLRHAAIVRRWRHPGRRAPGARRTGKLRAGGTAFEHGSATPHAPTRDVGTARRCHRGANGLDSGHRCVLTRTGRRLR